jgi:hypothetical protein
MTVIWHSFVNINQVINLPGPYPANFNFDIMSIPDPGLGQASYALCWVFLLEGIPGRISTPSRGQAVSAIPYDSHNFQIGGQTVDLFRHNTDTGQIDGSGPLPYYAVQFTPVVSTFWPVRINISGQVADAPECLKGIFIVFIDDYLITDQTNIVNLVTQAGSPGPAPPDVGNFDTSIYDDPSTVYVPQLVFGSVGTLNAIEPSTALPIFYTAQPPSISDSSGNWNNVERHWFDPYESLINNRFASPQNANISAVLFSPGTLPPNPTFAIFHVNNAPSGTGSASSAVVFIDALNSSGAVLGTSNTTSITSTGVGSSIILNYDNLPVGTVTFRLHVNWTTLPNVQVINCQTITYCNTRRPGTFPTAIPHRFGLALTEYMTPSLNPIPYSVAYTPTNNAPNESAITGLWRLDTISHRTRPTGGGNFVTILG